LLIKTVKTLTPQIRTKVSHFVRKLQTLLGKGYTPPRSIGLATVSLLRSMNKYNDDMSKK